ncbi:MAG: hypothetical protein RR816_14090, partial [Clostridia bacterium]
MLTSAQITIRDEATINIDGTAPATPALDQLWLDTSLSPNQFKRWNGTAWIACSAKPADSEIIVGTQTVSTAVWTGDANFFELKDGQEITYWLPQGSGSNVTLTLTLAN